MTPASGSRRSSFPLPPNSGHVFGVRAARPDDGPHLRRIEVLAGERFRDIGMADIADAEPASLEELADHAADGRAWVATDGDEPIGYVVVHVVDGNAHVDQVSVRPDFQGMGVGSALLDRVRQWAIEGCMTAMTLTTFTDVSWNRPLYEHLGFTVLRDDELGPELRAVRDDEATRGLHPSTRVCMRAMVHAQRSRTSGR